MADNELTEDDEEIVVVETDQLPEQGNDADRNDADDGDEEDDEDDRLAEDADEDPEGDVELNANRKKRLKRRQIQKAAKEAAQRELQMLRLQNEAMAKRLAAVEGNALSHNEMALDGRINEAEGAARNAETIIARAVESGNGEDVAAAIRMRDEALARAQQLKAAKQQVVDARNQPPAADPAAVSLAQEWMSANPWYDARGGNEDSAITNAIDARLVAEGYNPASVEYWNELTKRVRARISGGEAPRRSTSNMDNDAPRKKAPPMGSTREHAPQSTKKEVHVTPERKQAMIDAGIWDDPVRRTQMLKAYQAYDRNSAR